MASAPQIKKTILERLETGEVLIGDGGYVSQLERRGYVMAGPWTPEVNKEHPDAVQQLHKEFKRCGSDILQALTFYATSNRLLCGFTADEINNAACENVKAVADESTIVCGAVARTAAYAHKLGKEEVIKEIQQQTKIFLKHDVDFIMAEYFSEVEEIEWAIDALKACNKPIAAAMNIGPVGDSTGVSTKECGIRMAKAGADIIGLSCRFDPDWCISGIKLIKEGLEEAGIKRHLLLQPLGFRTPDAGVDGYASLPEMPFAMDSRTLTRFEVNRFARQAYDLGVRYLGGCCGFQAFHIRAIAEELARERGRLPEASDKHLPWGGALKQSVHEVMRQRNSREYWENVVPCCGRPGGTCQTVSSKPLKSGFKLT